MSEQFMPVPVNEGQQQLLLPAHIANEQAAKFMAPHEFSVDAQEMKAQELVIGTNGLGSIRAEAHGDNPEDVKADDLDRSIRDMLDPKNIIDLKAGLDHKTGRVNDESSYSVDTRLDKDGSKSQTAAEKRAELKDKLISQYTQTGVKDGEKRDVPQKVIDEISRNVDLSYEELEKRIQKADAKKAVNNAGSVKGTEKVTPVGVDATNNNTKNGEGTFAQNMLSKVHEAEEAKRKGDWTGYNSILETMRDVADQHEAETGKKVSNEFINRVDTRLDQASDGRIKRSGRANFMIDGVEGRNIDEVQETPEAAARTRRHRIRDAWDRAKVKLAHPIIGTRTGNRLRALTTNETEEGREVKRGAKAALVVGGLAAAAAGAYLATRGFGNGGGDKVRHATDVHNNTRGSGAGRSIAGGLSERGGKGGNPLEAAVNGRTKEVMDASGKYPWNRAASLYGHREATARLMSASDKLRASGAKVEWHGNPLASNKAWVSIDGVSDTKAVWARLSRAMAEDDAKRFFENISS